MPPRFLTGMLLLALLFLCAACSFTDLFYIGGEERNDVLPADGLSEATAFSVKNEDDLRKVGTGVDGWTPSAWYKQTGTIDLESSWTPLCTAISPFEGTYDGGGKTISGLIITSGGDLGLFSKVGPDGTVKDLKLAVDITTTAGSNIGGVAGSNSGTVQNCTVSGNVKGNNQVGGVVGHNTNIVQNCAVSGLGSVEGNFYVGGVVGYNDSGIVQNCYATVSVTVTDTGTGDYFGGVVGYHNSGTVINCYATGNVKGRDYVGGLAGNNSGTVENCYATGAVEGTGNTYISQCYVGGVAGYVNGTIQNCVALNNSIKGTTSDVGRVVGRDSSSGGMSNNYGRTPVNGGAGTLIMQLNGGDYMPSPNATGTDGDNVAADQYTTEDWWKGIWGTAYDAAWKWGAGILPVLR